MAKKSDNIEKYNRIRAVQEWILQGHATTDIVQNAAVKWDISERQAYDYLKWAFEEFKEQCKQTASKRKAFHIQARMRLYKTCLENKNLKVCREVLTDLGKLEGLYVDKIDITSDGESLTENIDLNKLTDAELATYLELTKKMGS